VSAFVGTFLTDDELVQLTGLRQGAAQIRWLRRNAIRHTVNAGGRPVVTVSALEPRSQQQHDVEPRFDLLPPIRSKPR